MRRYLLHLLASTALTLGLTAAFNGFTDPYAIFDGPRLPHINEAKPAIAENMRIYKMVGYFHRPMDALILGTSRATVGLDPTHRAFQGLKTLNLAMPAQPNAETALIFKYAAERNSLQTAVVGLDFFASNAYTTFTQDFTLDNLASDRKWKLLFSFDTLQAGFKTLFKTGNYPRAPNEAVTEVRRKFSRQALIESEKSYLWGGTYLPGPKCRFRFEAEASETVNVMRTPPLEEIRGMIALAHHNKVRLYLFISPSHARQWEILASVGLWETWEDWKRKLVKINEEEAARAQQPAFPLWDFSGYHSISTENLPDSKTPDAEMANYIDSSHYKPSIGHLLLDRLFGLQETGRPVPADFGMRLTADNVEEHLAAIRSARIRYRASHPQDIREIADLEAEVRQDNRCIDYAHAAPERNQARATDKDGIVIR